MNLVRKLRIPHVIYEIQKIYELQNFVGEKMPIDLTRPDIYFAKLICMEAVNSSHNLDLNHRLISTKRQQQMESPTPVAVAPRFPCS